ncbi:hypothetical protein E2L07_18250 [Halalkalibacterium halodurans]|uniref:hypothetical protein n=1 Tax=Halalkalibacterium halodurans TaxID=86665 RepID=UPI0010680F44|nr:hypothetical protein [Halalkalibacterium halodurans]TES48809.1 hypothetical protein E2L07_18250 [Halalkalibacterium halodurans]
MSMYKKVFIWFSVAFVLLVSLYGWIGEIFTHYSSYKETSSTEKLVFIFMILYGFYLIISFLVVTGTVVTAKGFLFLKSKKVIRNIAIVVVLSPIVAIGFLSAFVSMYALYFLVGIAMLMLSSFVMDILECRRVVKLK